MATYLTHYNDWLVSANHFHQVTDVTQISELSRSITEALSREYDHNCNCCCLLAVSCGQLIKQAIVQETKAGMAAKPYVEKDMMSKLISSLLN